MITVPVSPVCASFLWQVFARRQVDGEGLAALRQELTQKAQAIATVITDVRDGPAVEKRAAPAYEKYGKGWQPAAHNLGNSAS